MNPITKFLFELQGLSLLIWRSFTGIFRPPRYGREWVRQMDLIGVGSLPIVLLTGFFTGGVLVLQTFPTLQYYSIQNEAGRSVATSLIRELGPVLSGSHGVGPHRIRDRSGTRVDGGFAADRRDAGIRHGSESKARRSAADRPRVHAPLLTVAADIFGLIGGAIVANGLYNQDIAVFVNSARNGIQVEDIIGGVIKPLFFGLVIGSVACHKGLTTTGGTVGVGKSTTDAVVIASISVIIFDFFLFKALQYMLDMGRI